LYTIIQSQNLKKSQSFTNITRIYSKPPPSSFTAKEKIVFFINKYNINAIKSNHNPSCITKDAFTEYEKSIINKDFRIPFALGGPNKESANIYAFKEENFDQLLNKAFLEQLKKESSINHDNKTIKVSECFTKNIPNHDTQLKYLQQIYPKSRKEKYIIFSKSLSNVKK